MGKRIVTLLLLAFLLSPVAGRPAQSQQAQPPTHDILLLLPVPRIEQVQPGLAASDYTAEIAAPWLERLERLRAEGRVADFELLAQRHAIRITLWDDDPATLPGVSEEAIVPADPEHLACAERGAEAVRGVFQAARPGPAPSTTAHPQTSNPSIHAYILPSYGYVYGYTDPDVSVTMVLRGADGQVKATLTTISGSGGYYVFYPTYLSGCVGYDFTIAFGDTVEVSAAGHTTSLFIAPTTAFPDPTTETVHGTTAPNRSIEVGTYESRANCTATRQTVQTSSDGSGNYSAIFSPGFDRTTDAQVTVYDAEGNSFYTSFETPRIILETYYSGVYGYHWPNTAVNMALKRGGSTVSTYNTTSSASGYYSGHFTDDVLAGDVIEVHGGGFTMTLTAVEVSDMVLDPVADRISGSIGSLGAGRRVKVQPRRTSYGCFPYAYSCLSVTADGNGDFVLDYTVNGYDLMPGDRDYDPLIYDAEGNMQALRGALYVPVVAAPVGGHEINGYWSTTEADIHIVLRDGGGTIKEVLPAKTSSYSASFVKWFTASTAPGDIVEVGDGSITMSVVLPDLSAYLDLATDLVSGNAPAGSTVHVYLDGDFPDYHYYCGQTVALPTNTYSSDMGGEGVTAVDEVTVYYPTAEGYWAWVYSHAAAINAHKGGSEVDGHVPGLTSSGPGRWRAAYKEGSEVEGYVPLAGVSVTVSLERGGATVDSFTATSSDGYDEDEGFYSGQFPSETIQQGDIVWASIPGHDPVSFTVPLLTLNEDVPGNRLYGQTAPDSPVKGRLLVRYSTYSKYGESDSDGNYSVDFAGVYDSSCNPVTVGGCNRARVYSYDPEAHTAWLDGPKPPDVSADAYEPDNDFGSATPFTGIQDHTFHVPTDTDWISFTVEPDDVGRTYFLATLNLGPAMDTVLYLYDTNGTTLLAYDYSSGPGNASLIVWKAPAEGTYYVKVRPFSSGNTTVCGSFYSLMITSYHIYLPLLRR